MIDISGDWKYNVSGNDLGTVTIAFDKNTKIGNISGGNNISDNWRKIKYSDKGYSINNWQPAAFKDKTYNYLDGGNYFLKK